MSDKEFKEWIDAANYEMVLRRNRFGRLDDKIFQGDIGTYFLMKMSEKRRALSPEEQTTISKRIGW